MLEKNRLLREAELASAKRAIQEVARRERKSVEEVRAAMIDAMKEGFNSEDPEVRAMWAQIPCEGEMPTPEELIGWASRQIRNSRFS